jgi:1-acyl-sn-glycerol-3-phosphate acyltransferase
VKSRTYRLIGLLTVGPLRRLFRVRSKGEENLPANGGYVLSANHMSNLDPWPLAIPLYPKRQVRFMAKAEIYKRPLKWVLDGAGAFPVRRGLGDEAALNRAIELVRSGEVVAIFPEGTRRNKGSKKRRPRPRRGAARVALTADVPLVPAAISGTESLMKLGPLSVAYGEPIELDDLKDMELREAAKIATDRLMDAIYSLERTL